MEIDASRVDHRPSTFSGGMLQRLQIARTLVTHPRLVFMDEPTGGLDVSVQARLLDLIRGLVARLGIAAVLVTHDLAVARLLAHRVMVMQQGCVVESGLTDQVLDDPQHPYTRGLLGAVPKLGSSLTGNGRTKLTEITGQVPSLRKPIIGCAFAGRCPDVTEICRSMAPAVEEKTPDHLVACHHAQRRIAA